MAGGGMTLTRASALNVVRLELVRSGKRHAVQRLHALGLVELCGVSGALYPNAERLLLRGRPCMRPCHEPLQTCALLQADYEGRLTW